MKIFFNSCNRYNNFCDFRFRFFEKEISNLIKTTRYTHAWFENFQHFRLCFNLPDQIGHVSYWRSVLSSVNFYYFLLWLRKFLTINCTATATGNLTTAQPGTGACYHFFLSFDVINYSKYFRVVERLKKIVTSPCVLTLALAHFKHLRSNIQYLGGWSLTLKSFYMIFVSF